MGKLVIKNNIFKAARDISDNMDRALNRMAIDIEKLAKDKVPRKKKHLKQSGYHLRIKALMYVIIFNKEYAAYQEFGGDGKGKVVRNYTVPGTGKGYLRDSAKTIVAHAPEYLKSEAFRLRRKI